MKKMKTILSILIAIVSTVLVGCAKFHGTNVSVYSEVWPILAIGVAASLTLWVVVYFQSKSGSTKDNRNLGYGAIEESVVNVPFYETNFFPWAVSVTLLTIAAWIGIYFSK